MMRNWGGARPRAGRKPKPTKDATKPRAPLKISADAVLSSKRKGKDRIHPFIMANHPPSVFPKGKRPTLAMDEAVNASLAWSSQIILNGMFSEGLGFLGYPYLAELTQRAEYRVLSETIAEEATRKWIRIQAATVEAPGKPGEENPETEPGESDKTDKIKAIEAEFERLKVQDVFRLASTTDGFFGRSHVYIDIGDSRNELEELKTPIGNGRNKISAGKITKGTAIRLHNVEPIWCYPSYYNATDPLSPEWYKPEHWFCMGKELHASRLLTFVGHPVPDLLKPAYSFGGLSLSQMAKPYVDNWLRTRQSVADIVHAFSVMVLSTDLSEVLAGAGSGEELFKRLEIFNNYRDNRGIMAVNKETEELTNVSAPLSSLDLLQAQTQEHMAAVSKIPIVKLLGIQPAGLNASSEGEIKTFDDTIAAYQEKFFGEPLKRILGMVQLSLFGEVDPQITAEFEPLRQMTEKEQSEIDKAEAEADQVRIDSGVIWPGEARQRLAAAEDSPYSGIDVDDVPDLAAEEEAGLDPEGSRPDPKSENEPPSGAKDEVVKSLYVSRRLVNTEDLLSWAIEQGFSKTMKPDQLHVTVAFSKTPVSWSSAGNAIDSVSVSASARQRTVEKLGDKGAVVLRFPSSDLSSRWKEFRDIGASWDWPEYKPHITISYDAGDIELTKVKPYKGELRFGPEVYAQIDDDWAEKAKAGMDSHDG